MSISTGLMLDVCCTGTGNFHAIFFHVVHVFDKGQLSDKPKNNGDQEMHFDDDDDDDDEMTTTEY